MNPLSKIKYLIPALVLCCSAPILRADEAERDILDLSIEENLAVPDVPSKAATYVRTAMDQLRRQMLRNGYEAKLIRDGEVLEVTIPAGTLFAANDTVLKPSGATFLRNIGVLAAEPSRYKLLIAVHTDNTGDEQYADALTSARANAIDDLLWQLAAQRETNTVPYGLGRDEPLYPNTSRVNREKNRRVEIYVVPDNGLLQLAGVKPKKK